MKGASKEWIVAFFIVLLLFVGAVLVIDGTVMPYYTRHGEEVEVPDIVEMDLAGADSALAAKGFKLVVEEEKYDSHYPEGTIIDQNPDAFSITKRGRRIYATVSIGEQLSVMPNLVGKSFRDAEFTLHTAGLSLNDQNVGYEYSYYYPNSVLMAQSIPPGTKLKKDTPIHVTVSLGNLPSEFRIPNLIGQPLDRARKIILTSGLSVGKLYIQYRKDLLPNTVIEQFPPADEKAEKGAEIDMTISTLDPTGREEDSAR